MSSERERLAREWAERIMSTTLEMIDPVQRAAAEHILATTPEPTMEDVTWDEDEHYLAGCMTQYGEMVMLRPHGVNLLVHDLNSGLTEIWDRGDATPNGKRYELREVGVSPAELSASWEYRDAPLGTVIAEPVGHPWIKTTPDGWESGGLTRNCQGMFEIGPHRVLRMGDGI